MNVTILPFLLRLCHHSSVYSNLWKGEIYPLNFPINSNQDFFTFLCFLLLSSCFQELWTDSFSKNDWKVKKSRTNIYQITWPMINLSLSVKEPGILRLCLGWTSYKVTANLASEKRTFCQKLWKIKMYSFTPSLTQILLWPTPRICKNVHLRYQVKKLVGLSKYQNPSCHFISPSSLTHQSRDNLAGLVLNWLTELRENHTHHPM